MMTLSKLIVQGKTAVDFVPPGYRLVQTWTTSEWSKAWQWLLDKRPDGWKKLPRASHEQMERLMPGNVPLHVLDGILYHEAKLLVARVEDDAHRGHCWALLVGYDASEHACERTST